MVKMLAKILPEQINSEFSGHNIAMYAFIAIAIVTIAGSLAHNFLPDGGSGSIATIDLSVEGVETIVGIFAQWGLSQLLMGVFHAIVYFRYKSLIPLIYIIIIVEYLWRILMGLAKPIETIGTAPGVIGNLIVIPLAVIFFILAIMNPNNGGNQDST